MAAPIIELPGEKAQCPHCGKKATIIEEDDKRVMTVCINCGRTIIRPVDLREIVRRIRKAQKNQ